MDGRRDPSSSSNGSEAPVWYARWRDAYGQHMEKIGLAHQGKGRAAGTFTRRTAEAELRRILAAEQGAFAPKPAYGLTFGDACDRWLEYIRDDRKRRRSTVVDYQNMLGRLKAQFGADTPREDVTTEKIDALRR